MLAFGALGDEAGGGAPDGQEALLHRVLGERRVADDAQREPVGDAAEAVVELRQGVFVGAGDESDERLVGQVSEPRAMTPRPFRGGRNASTAAMSGYSEAPPGRFGPADRTDCAGSRIRRVQPPTEERK